MTAIAEYNNFVGGSKMDIADKLKLYRKDSKLTQSQVADSLNVSRKTISSWENGRNFPDINSIVMLSDIYHVSLDALLRDDQILSHYHTQDKISRLDSKLLSLSFRINVVLLILGYFNIFRFFGDAGNSLISLFTVVNLVIFITHFPWAIVSLNRQRILSTSLIFILILLINLVLDLKVNALLKLMVQNSSFFDIGIVVGELFFVLILSIECIILLLASRKGINKLI